MDPTTFDLSKFNWIGFALSVVANMVIGFVWYASWSPTGARWMKHQGMDPKNLPKMDGKAMAMSMVLMVVGALLMMFVFAHNFAAYGDAFLYSDGGYKMGIMDGVMGGLFTWLGFIVPLNLNQVAFERKPWGLFGINAGYYLVTLVLAGILLVTVGAK
ncbi:MAG TPA: DUF1761 domain-containing protein [Candidatus Thermoplasmatota archaeon]|nr:DUF1761 domain-containing protein [Candidatus Thermoplasmatota archaeon]